MEYQEKPRTTGSATDAQVAAHEQVKIAGGTHFPLPLHSSPAQQGLVLLLQVSPPLMVSSAE